MPRETDGGGDGVEQIVEETERDDGDREPQPSLPAKPSEQRHISHQHDEQRERGRQEPHRLHQHAAQNEEHRREPGEQGVALSPPAED